MIHCQLVWTSWARLAHEQKLCDDSRVLNEPGSYSMNYLRRLKSRDLLCNTKSSLNKHCYNTSVLIAAAKNSSGSIIAWLVLFLTLRVGQCGALEVRSKVSMKTRGKRHSLVHRITITCLSININQACTWLEPRATV